MRNVPSTLLPRTYDQTKLSANIEWCFRHGIFTECPHDVSQEIFFEAARDISNEHHVELEMYFRQATGDLVRANRGIPLGHIPGSLDAHRWTALHPEHRFQADAWSRLTAPLGLTR